MAESFSYKFTTESKTLAFEFSEALANGEALVSATCTIIVIDGVDANPNNVLNGSASITGTQVLQQVIYGVAGVTYRLIATVVTSNSNVLVGIGDMPVYSVSEV